MPGVRPAVGPAAGFEVSIAVAAAAIVRVGTVASGIAA
jgi:hypothetical protein